MLTGRRSNKYLGSESLIEERAHENKEEPGILRAGKNAIEAGTQDERNSQASRSPLRDRESKTKEVGATKTVCMIASPDL